VRATDWPHRYGTDNAALLSIALRALLRNNIRSLEAAASGAEQQLGNRRVNGGISQAPLRFSFRLALTQHLREIALQHDTRNILILVVREGLEPSTSAL